MTDATGPGECTLCGRRFGGQFGFDRHRPITWNRCRTDEELREIGMVKNRLGIWIRADFRRPFPKRDRQALREQERRKRERRSGTEG